MFELSPTSEVIEGGFVGIIFVSVVLLYLRYVDSRLMACERPLSAKLTITKYFRGLIACLIAGGLLTSPAIISEGLAGTTSELAFAVLITLMLLVIVMYLVLQVFLTQVYIAGDTITLHSPLGVKQLELPNLTAASLNSGFQLELVDTNLSIRFCHYVRGKRALIEHIIERAPASATRELQGYLTKTGQKKQPTTSPLASGD